MKPIVMIAKFFGYQVGGAELSLLQLLKKKEQAGHPIIVYQFDNIKSFQAQQLKITLPTTWRIHRVQIPYDWQRFSHLSYLFSYRQLKRIAENLPRDAIIYSYGLYAPALLHHARAVDKHYFVRDEYGLGWHKNYYRGWRYFAKMLYLIGHWPFIALWRAHLKRTLKTCNLHANSQFIANELKKIASQHPLPQRPIIVEYSTVDEADLKMRYQRIRQTTNDTPHAIVMFGNSHIKGSDIFKRIAARLPQYTFMVFSRLQPPRQSGNLHYASWQSNNANSYAKARIVLLPSRWHEAYPRVCLETAILNIPLITHRIGGIAEAAGKNALFIERLEDIDSWVQAIQSVISTSPSTSDS